MTMAVRHDDEPRPARWRPLLWGGIAALLLLPLVAMQFSDDMRWTGSDFVAAALLLVGGGALFELSARFVRDRGRRRLIGAAVALAVFLVWLDGSAGIF